MAEGSDGSASACLCCACVFPHFSPITSFPIQLQLQAKMESHIGTA